MCHLPYTVRPRAHCRATLRIWCRAPGRRTRALNRPAMRARNIHAVRYANRKEILASRVVHNTIALSSLQYGGVVWGGEVLNAFGRVSRTRGARSLFARRRRVRRTVSVNIKRNRRLFVRRHEVRLFGHRYRLERRQRSRDDVDQFPHSMFPTSEPKGKQIAI